MECSCGDSRYFCGVLVRAGFICEKSVDIVAARRIEQLRERDTMFHNLAVLNSFFNRVLFIFFDRLFIGSIARGLFLLIRWCGPVR